GRVVELWSLAATDLLAANDVGLVPWLPLTQFDGAPEDLLRHCRERIDRDAPQELQANLLAVTQVMAKLRYNDRGLLSILGGRKVMLESPLIQEIVAEVRAETEVRTQQKAIATVLEARFGRLPRKLTAAVNRVN